VKAKPSQNGQIMTLREAALYLHCHPSTLYRLAKCGAIPAFRVGGSWRFHGGELDRWIARRTTRTA
jgi:excisionase family DNA binding protein